MSRGIVDRALDAYLAEMGRKSIDPEGVRVSSLAALVGVPTSAMSHHLQQYLRRQAKGVTRYVIGCEGYGNPKTSSNPPRWKIMAKPNSDPKVVQRARLAHAKYLAHDNLTKTVRDYTRETFPGLGGTDLDRTIETVVQGMLQHLKVDVDTAVRLLNSAA